MCEGGSGAKLLAMVHEMIGVSLFTSDAFLEAFSLVINATPVYGKGIWIRRGRFINKAEGSAWNLFARNPNIDDMIEVSKEYDCWFLRFTAAAPLDDKRLGAPIRSPTMLTFPDYRPNKDVRWGIRKAEKSGFIVEACSVSVIQPLLNQLWTKLGHGIPQRFYEILEKASIGKALVARLSDKICSGLFYLVDEDDVWYMYSLATDRSFRSSQVTSLLVYSFIRQAFDEGSNCVDLCGSSIPSIAGFKKQFASKTHCRPMYEVSLNPLYPLARTAGRILGLWKTRYSQQWTTEA
jgi:hypothetical protein